MYKTLNVTFFLHSYPLQPVFSSAETKGWGFQTECQLSRVSWLSWLVAGAEPSGQVMTLTNQGLLCILWIFSSNKAKSHEKASGHCAGAFVCPGLLWVGAAPQGTWRNEEALLYCWGMERSWQVLQTFYPSHHLCRWGGHFHGLVGVTVTVTSDCFSFLNRCARGGCGAESPRSESPRGSQLHASV